MKKLGVWCWFMLSLTGLWAADTIPGQQTMPMVPEIFQFMPGSWADYTILDRASNESYRMWFAVLERETYKKTPCIWMEVDVRMEDQPRVVTRFLAEETESGPGELKKVIVYVAGHTPFNVPKKYFTGKNQQVDQFNKTQKLEKLERLTLEHAGRMVEGWRVKAVDEQGQEMSAFVSEQIPPLAVVTADTEAVSMVLDDWGVDARTRIQGSPISFYLWIFEELARGLSEPGK